MACIRLPFYFNTDAPLSITHSPGMMFITDLVQEPFEENLSRKDDQKYLVIEYSTRDQKYSLLSVATHDRLNTLYSAVCVDPGKSYNCSRQYLLYLLHC